MSYQVNEVFNTIQGEGIKAGTPATFIRLQGCTVGCEWCDTKYTWTTGGQRWEAKDLVSSLDLRPLAVITGGEPTLYDLDDLLFALRNAGQARWGYDFKIQLETSGQNAFKGKVVPDWVTWSPKPNLDFKAHPGLLRHIAEVKWVVDDNLTMDIIDKQIRVVRAAQPQNRVWCVLMPEGCPPSEEHVKKTLGMLEVYPAWTFSDRLQWRLGVK
jgi:organic radical activating enzyme